jgi:plasmid maintenance system antidote protein VapI
MNAAQSPKQESAGEGMVRPDSAALIVRTLRSAIRELLVKQPDAKFVLALRLSRAFGASPQVWLNVQAEVMSEEK